jgi:hypothetical protein
MTKLVSQEFDPKQQFVGLPIESLILAPILAVAEGQRKLCEVYLTHLFRLAYKNPSADKKETNTIEFNLERPVQTALGVQGTQSVKVVAPLLALVPIPAFTMEEITVDFTMSVKEETSDTTTNNKNVSLDTDGMSRYFPMVPKITGSVTSNHEHIRKTDNSATYTIKAKASRQEPVEGMNKLTALFNAMIEPIAINSGN